ncbi:MAG: 4-hydroxy-tetrahydrodipicolinate synthase [Bryobacteraceae bacterium]|nr:4-hydroxy-tetrahydrodipicolinate synthase [Bryobacteraceae bacterium]
MKFKGCGTALVTPFTRDGAVDYGVLRRLVRRQIDAGVHFLVPCGTTGESPTLERDEHLQVVKTTIEEAGGKVPVLAGAGGYNTKEVVAMARELESLGADGILSVTPYYNKPTQEGLYQHYKTIADAIQIPIVLYSVQGRTGVNIEPATIRRLAGIPNIVGVKEASGNIAQIANICATVPEDFAVVSGDDSITLALAGLGGHGIISVAGNEIPAEMAALAQACLDGDFPKARAIQKKWLPLMEVNFVESNPMPVKHAMARMGLLEPVWRQPMIAPSEAAQQRIDAVLKSLGLTA